MKKKLLSVLLALVICGAVSVVELLAVRPDSAVVRQTAIEEAPRKWVKVSLDLDGYDFNGDFKVVFYDEEWHEKKELILTKKDGYVSQIDLRMDSEYFVYSVFDDTLVDGGKNHYNVVSLDGSPEQSVCGVMDKEMNYKLHQLPPAPTADELNQQGAELLKNFMIKVEPYKGDLEKNINSGKNNRHRKTILTFKTNGKAWGSLTELCMMIW